jgi:hypothetical protein
MRDVDPWKPTGHGKPFQEYENKKLYILGKQMFTKHTSWDTN